MQEDIIDRMKCVNCNFLETQNGKSYCKIEKKSLEDLGIKSIYDNNKCNVFEENSKTGSALAKLHSVYKKWLHVKDDRRIDLVLAVALTRDVPGTKLWLLIVSNSGDWKSEQLHALDDDEENTRVIKALTSKTIVSGSPSARDLAPSLRDKIILIPEMAQLLTLHPNEKSAVWAQLRDLYDGIAGKDSGTGKSSSYKDLNVTLIGCSTPAIDSQILIHQSLGSRELIYRPPKEDESSEEELMDKVNENEKHEEEMRNELRDITIGFLKQRVYVPIDVPPEIFDKLKGLSNYLRFMRSPAEFDTWTGELINNAHPEKPTRILKQLKRLYLGLKSLDETYTDERALSVIAEVVRSSSFPNRIAVYKHLHKNPSNKPTEYKISKDLRIGRKTVYRELNVLWNLGLINKEGGEEITEYGSTKEKVMWQVNTSTKLFSFLKNK
jgi:hypothetical protein